VSPSTDDAESCNRRCNGSGPVRWDGIGRNRASPSNFSACPAHAGNESFLLSGTGYANNAVADSCTGHALRRRTSLLRLFGEASEGQCDYVEQ
jgi:hypothetical protein